MFVKNAWYCAGWSQDLSLGRDRLLARQLAGEYVVLYRKSDGAIVAMEDRCPHRQAALSRGTKEGDGIRCGYHGLRFGPDGRCLEIPGQDRIPDDAVLRTYPVVEKNSWIWVWLGEPARADESLICFAVGPDDPGWNIKTSEVSVRCNYRLEITNLMDLSHLAWVHKNTLGGTDEYTRAKVTSTTLERGVHNDFTLRRIPPPKFAQHVFPPGTTVDAHFDINCTLPCNWILHFRAFAPDAANEGPPQGQLLLDTFTCQSVTPRDEDWVDYYYSWGASTETDVPGLSDMLREATDAAFVEDKAVLEAQWERAKDNPEGNRIDIKNDAAGEKMLWVLDKFLREERGAYQAA